MVGPYSRLLYAPRIERASRACRGAARYQSSSPRLSLAGMDAHPDYTAAWRGYRKRSLVLWAIFLGYIPGVFVLFVGAGLPIAALTGTKPDYFFYPIAGSWMLAFLIPADVSRSLKLPPLSLPVETRAAAENHRERRVDRRDLQPVQPGFGSQMLRATNKTRPGLH